MNSFFPLMIHFTLLSPLSLDFISSSSWLLTGIITILTFSYIPRVVDLANKNTGHPVKFTFQVNNEWCFSISVSHVIFPRNNKYILILEIICPFRIQIYLGVFFYLENLFLSPCSLWLQIPLVTRLWGSPGSARVQRNSINSECCKPVVSLPNKK